MEARSLDCCSGKRRQWGHGRVLSAPGARGLELAGVSRSSEAKVSRCNCPAPSGHMDSPEEERPERSRGRERESSKSAEDLLKLPKNQPLPRNDNRNGFPYRQHDTDQELLPRGAWGAPWGTRLPSAQVMIPGAWDGAARRAPRIPLSDKKSKRTAAQKQ